MSVTTCATVLPSTAISSPPPVTFRTGGGIRTLAIRSTPFPRVVIAAPPSSLKRGAAPSPVPELRVERLEVGQPRAGREWLLHRAIDRLEGLVSVARHADDDRLVARNAALFDQLLGHRQCGAA